MNMETVSSSTAAAGTAPLPLHSLLLLLLRQVQRVCHVAFDLLGAPTVGCCQRGRSLLNFLNKIIVAYFSARTQFSHVCRSVCVCTHVLVCLCVCLSLFDEITNLLRLRLSRLSKWQRQDTSRWRERKRERETRREPESFVRWWRQLGRLSIVACLADLLIELIVQTPHTLSHSHSHSYSLQFAINGTRFIHFQSFAHEMNQKAAQAASAAAEAAKMLHLRGAKLQAATCTIHFATHMSLAKDLDSDGWLPDWLAAWLQ